VCGTAVGARIGHDGTLRAGAGHGTRSRPADSQDGGEARHSIHARAQCRDPGVGLPAELVVLVGVDRPILVPEVP
jgi:hypothetical protein